MSKRMLRALRGKLPARMPQDVGPDELRARILGDPYLFRHYVAVYTRLVSFVPKGNEAVVEVGSGSGIIDFVDDSVIKTDVFCSGIHDLCTDARSLPFAANSIRALILKDTLHHVPDVEVFFREAQRVLVPKGRVIVMEPYWGKLASFVYRRFHPEPFDVHARSWVFPDENRFCSNQALLFLLLRRDRQLFEELFSDFSIEEIGACVGPSFAISGGLYGRLPIRSSFLLRLHGWEERQGRKLDFARFGFLAVFEKKCQSSGVAMP